jgi:hypothetical protein
MPYTPPSETLAAAASRPISEALSARVVLGHPRATLHPYTCGLHEDATAFTVVLTGYDSREGCCRDNHKEEAIVIDYFLNTDA